MSLDSNPLQHDVPRAEHAAEILRAVAHTARLRIIAALRDGQLHVGALAAVLGIERAIVSQQLRILRMQRLVESERLNGFVYYRIAEPQLRNLLRCLEGCAPR